MLVSFEEIRLLNNRNNQNKCMVNRRFNSSNFGTVAE